MTKPVPPPPIPPLPPPGLVEQLQETIETQARSLRVILANYDALLKKFERERPDRDHPPPFEIEWQMGPSKTFMANQKIEPEGLWYAPVQVAVDFDNKAGGFLNKLVDAHDLFLATGTTRAASPITIRPVDGEIIWSDEE